MLEEKIEKIKKGGIISLVLFLGVGGCSGSEIRIPTRLAGKDFCVENFSCCNFTDCDIGEYCSNDGTKMIDEKEYDTCSCHDIYVASSGSSSSGKDYGGGGGRDRSSYDGPSGKEKSGSYKVCKDRN